MDATHTSLSSHGRFHYLLFVTCGLCLMTVIMEMLDIGYLLPAAHCDLGLTTKDKGTLNAMVFAEKTKVQKPKGENLPKVLPSRGYSKTLLTENKEHGIEKGKE
uniref:Uncharacterized protein n=1 Tax=Timema tahoe TaxID=61484 RepID=A0A7R9IQS1_9NEOP|nr:unnamed protein product [Timema tahoe]